MSDASSRELQPVAALRQAITNTAVALFVSHPGLRFFLGATGAVLFVVGVVAAPFWNVPLLSWLSGGQVAGACLSGGLGALGVWYLSGRSASNRSTQNTNEAARELDLVGQLERLKELHSSGDLTDEEFQRAKTRVLK